MTNHKKINMNNISKLFVLAFATLGLSSCLEDQFIEDQKYGMINLDAHKIIELPSAVNVLALPLEDKTTSVNFVTVHLAANEVAAEDIKVTLDMSKSAQMVADYNEEHETEYVDFPASLYSLSEGLVVTIPKGSRDGVLKLSTNASKFDPALSYALGFSVASVDKPGYTISGNFKNSVVAISAKNKYDGVYTYRASMTGSDRPTINATGQEWEWATPVHLVTRGENVVNLFDAEYYQDYILPIQTNTGGRSGFGSTNLRLTFDGTTNKITDISNAFPNPANGRAFEIDPTGQNYFDPATHDVYATFFMTQPGFQPLKIKLTLKYKEPR
jgi:Domain of unknown function (DUF1735)